jgi:hypothetical protein
VICVLDCMAIKSRRVSWAGYIARMKLGITHATFCSENLNGRDHFGRPMNRWEHNIQCIVKK